MAPNPENRKSSEEGEECRKKLRRELNFIEQSRGATRNLSWGVLNFFWARPTLPLFPLLSILLPPPALDVFRPC